MATHTHSPASVSRSCTPLSPDLNLNAGGSHPHHSARCADAAQARRPEPVPREPAIRCAVALRRLITDVFALLRDAARNAGRQALPIAHVHRCVRCPVHAAACAAALLVACELHGTPKTFTEVGAKCMTSPSTVMGWVNTFNRMPYGSMTAQQVEAAATARAAPAEAAPAGAQAAAPQQVGQGQARTWAV